MEWLQHLSADRLLMLGFLLGLWWSDARSRGSFREHGKRLGRLAGQVNKIFGHLEIKDDGKEGGE
jgi:hypothetical protein